MMKRMSGRATNRTRCSRRALDVLFILHADHEQNCSTSVMRSTGSSQVDPYSAVAAASAALYGPAARWRQRGRCCACWPKSAALPTSRPSSRKSKKARGRKKLMGFGHRVYKNYDPRAKVIKRLAEEVFEVTGRNPLLDIALELERIALQDDYFVKRKLYPNVDFYSGLIYQAMGFPVDMFPVLFAIPGPRAGWRSGAKCSTIPSRKLPVRVRFTPARIVAITRRNARTRSSSSASAAKFDSPPTRAATPARRLAARKRPAYFPRFIQILHDFGGQHDAARALRVAATSPARPCQYAARHAASKHAFPTRAMRRSCRSDIAHPARSHRRISRRNHRQCDPRRV